LLALLAITASCQPKSEVKKLSWLTGDWITTNPKPGRTEYESWKLGSNGELGGVSLVMKGTDTLFVEKFRIDSRGGDLYYVADVPGNKEPVDFKITRITDNGFTCENPKHDFPKKIVYVKDGNNIKATISGDGRVRDFFYVRRN
jgi:hypothetical protein